MLKNRLTIDKKNKRRSSILKIINCVFCIFISGMLRVLYRIWYFRLGNVPKFCSDTSAWYEESNSENPKFLSDPGSKISKERTTHRHESEYSALSLLQAGPKISRISNALFQISPQDYCSKFPQVADKFYRFFCDKN